MVSGHPLVPRPQDPSSLIGINSAEGPLWKEQRRFVVNTLKDFGFGRPILEPKIIEEAEYLLDAIGSNEGQPFDPRPLVSNAVSNVICSMVFGHRFALDSELRDQLDRLNYRASQSRRNTLSAQSIFPWYQHYYPPGKRQLKRFIQEGEEIMRFLQKEIDLCKQTFNIDDQPSCFVHAFLKAQATGVGQYFTDEQLRSTTFDLFLAGTDTTVSTLRWSIYYMAANPDIQIRVRQEVKSVLESRWPTMADRSRLVFTEAVLMEVHRIASIVPLSVMHRTTAPTRLRGYDLPEWAYVLPLIWAVHRDERFYPHPDKFDPTRFLVTIDNNGEQKLSVRKDLPLIPFSVGKRACPGEPLARMELFIYFIVMMQNFHFTFPDDHDANDGIGCSVGFIRSPDSFLVCASRVEP